MQKKLIGALAVAAVVAVPAVASADRPSGHHPAAAKSEAKGKPEGKGKKGKGQSRRCKKIAVAKGFVVAGTVSAVGEGASVTDGAYSGSFTVTVASANKHARNAGFERGASKEVTLEGVRVSVEDGADTTLAAGERVKLIGKILVPRSTKKFRCDATVGNPTYKRVVLRAADEAADAAE